MGDSPLEEMTMHVGVAPQGLPHMVTNLAPLLDATPFVADLGNGQLYVSGVQDIERVRQSARAVGGYAVVLSAPPAERGNLDVWGHSPDTLDLMRALKTRWDAGGLLNPGAFVV
jgi:hypothetical protein